MTTSPPTFTFGRVVALVAIGLVLAGLAWLQLAPDGTVSVPAGARAGQLTLEPCTYATDDGDHAADCGTLVVPENRARSSSRLIALPVTRIRARTSQPATPVFRLEGGPGLSNMDFPTASRLAGTRDVVLVGYRGVDGSSRLDCAEVVDVMRRSADLLGSGSLRRQATAFADCAARLRGEGVDLAGYSLPQRVDDLEAARRALRYPRVDLVSESAGTRTAMIYAWRHPRSVRRSVMIGANPPGHFLWDARTIDGQIERYSRLCAAAPDCRARTSDLARTIKRNADAAAGRWGPLKIKAGNVRLGTFWGLMESSTKAAPLASPMTIDSHLDAAGGDRAGLWFQSLAANLIFPRVQVWGDAAAVARADVDAVAAHFARPARRDSIIGDPGSRFVWAAGALAKAWPAAPDEDAYDEVRTSRVETLVVSGSVDLAAPAQAATRELMPHLPNGHQVVLREFGHTTDMWNAQADATTHLVRTFLDEGRVDTSRFARRRIDFAPSSTQSALAKLAVTIMSALALITLVALVALPLRLRRRRRFGAVSGALVRSLLAPVVGLGGWALGSLLVLSAAPSVPIDDELLIAFATGVPVALASYWGWVDRDGPFETRLVGLAGALLAALVGGWVGLGAGTGLVAPVAATAGAVAAANLALIAGAIARERAPSHEPPVVAPRQLVGV